MMAYTKHRNYKAILLKFSAFSALWPQNPFHHCFPDNHNQIIRTDPRDRHHLPSCHEHTGRKLKMQTMGKFNALVVTLLI